MWLFTCEQKLPVTGIVPTHLAACTDGPQISGWYCGLSTNYGLQLGQMFAEGWCDGLIKIPVLARICSCTLDENISHEKRCITATCLIG